MIVIAKGNQMWNSSSDIPRTGLPEIIFKNAIFVLKRQQYSQWKSGNLTL